MFSSLNNGYRIAVIGASGGIGSSIAEKLTRDPRCENVHAFSRSGTTSTDILSEDSLAEAASSIPDTIDGLIIATGQLSFEDGTKPEKSISQIEHDKMLAMLNINAVGPALVLKHFMPKLNRKDRCLIAALSARVGSIGDNNLGGWVSYRASKAALNQIVRTSALELKRKNAQSICVALHPGTVPTKLSSDLASGKFTHSPAECAVNLMGVLDDLSPDQTGQFFDYSGAPIPW